MGISVIIRTVAVLALAGSANWGVESAPTNSGNARPAPPSDDVLTLPATLVTKRTSPATTTLPASAPRLSATAAQAGGFRLKADVDLIMLEATVRDQYGAIVANLKRDDFHLYEDGVEQQISHFSRDELPLAMALVLDRSGSMSPVLKQLHRVAYGTLSLLKPDDQVALIAFAARPELLEDLTTDRQRITHKIATIRAAGATVIPDALFEAADYLGRAAEYRRRVIILVSDNENTLEGYCSEGRAIRQALEGEAVIYSIRVGGGDVHSPMYVVRPTWRSVSVPKIVRETGGEVIDAQDVNSIQSAMAAVISRLKQSYTLGYYSTNPRHDGAFRKIEIRIAEGSNDTKRKYTVYARRGYYVRAEPVSSSTHPDARQRSSLPSPLPQAEEEFGPSRRVSR